MQTSDSRNLALDLKTLSLNLEELDFLIHSIDHAATYFKNLSNSKDDPQVITSFPPIKSRIASLEVSISHVLQHHTEERDKCKSKISSSLQRALYIRDYTQIKQASFSFGSFGHQPRQFSSPSGVAVSPENNIYVCDTGNNRIQIFDDKGVFLGQFGEEGSHSGQFRNPTGLAIDKKKKRVLVTDKFNARVQIFDLMGNFINMFGSFGTEPGEFKNPFGIGCDQNGTIYVLDDHLNSIQIFDHDGRYLRKIQNPRHRNEEPLSLSGMGVFANGDIVVSERRLNRLYLFDTLGNLVKLICETNIRGAYFLAIDPWDRILVSQCYQNQIEIFSKEGTLLAFFGKHTLWYAMGVALTEDGNIIVSDLTKIHVF